MMKTMLSILLGVLALSSGTAMAEVTPPFQDNNSNLSWSEVAWKTDCRLGGSTVASGKKKLEKRWDKMDEAAREKERKKILTSVAKGVWALYGPNSKNKSHELSSFKSLKEYTAYVQTEAGERATRNFLVSNGNHHLDELHVAKTVRYKAQGCKVSKKKKQQVAEKPKVETAKPEVVNNVPPKKTVAEIAARVEEKKAEREKASEEMAAAAGNLKKVKETIGSENLTKLEAAEERKKKAEEAVVKANEQ